jgi:hypothetical protein
MRNSVKKKWKIGYIHSVCQFKQAILILQAAGPDYAVTCPAPRVKGDPAFDGIRKSGNRMKKVSPIAAAL